EELVGPVSALAQPLANESDVRMPVARPQPRTGWDLDAWRDRLSRLGILSAARCEQRLLQIVETFVLRVKPSQIRVGRVRNSDRLNERFRVVDVGTPIEKLADRGRIEAAAAGVARIFEDGKSQPDFGLGTRLHRRRSIRQLR